MEKGSVMKVSLNRELLKSVINVVRLAQGSGATNEWTKGIKIDATGDDIVMSATDLVTGISIKIDGNIEEPGKVLVNGDLLNKMVELYAADTVEFESDKSLNISCGGDSGEYEILKVNDFVDIEIAQDDPGWFSIPVSLIADADNKVRFAAATFNSSRPQMASVYFVIRDGILKVVACDGCKLALLKTEVSSDLPSMQILIPGDTVAKIHKAFKEYGTEESVDMNIQKDKVYFRSGNLMVSAGLVEGSYFKYEKIFPKEIRLSMVFDRKELSRKIAIADIANSFSSDAIEVKDIAIKISGECFNQGIAKIVNSNTVKNKQIGEIPFVTELGEIGEDFYLWIDTKYALEVLKNNDSNEIQIDIDTPHIPFRISGKGNDNYIAIVMPKK